MRDEPNAANLSLVSEFGVRFDVIFRPLRLSARPTFHRIGTQQFKSLTQQHCHTSQSQHYARHQALQTVARIRSIALPILLIEISILHSTHNWNKMRLIIAHEPQVSQVDGARRDKRIDELKAQADHRVGKLNDKDAAEHGTQRDHEADQRQHSESVV